MTRLTSSYGMLAVLLLLCGYYSLATLREQTPVGAAAAVALVDRLGAPPAGGWLVAGRTGVEDRAFVAEAERRLRERGDRVAAAVCGGPPELRRAIEAAGEVTVVGTPEVAAWPLLAGRPVETPPSRRFPTFLKRDNLLNIANQIAVIAIIAVGMTMVIITAGIDLSVGSLLALSACVCAAVIRLLGGPQAGLGGMLLGALAALVGCGLVGALSGLLITGFRLPPFIATLGMMQVASGLAYILSRGQSIYEVPDGFVWLGRGADLFGLPNAVVLMGLIYLAAHLLMTRTRLGRAIYAVGGNAEAARLSGVRLNRVLLFVYTITAVLAGLGGVIMASQLKSGAPTYGQMYELFVIAAVVVGGTSLSGGSGTIHGTLIGAFIIAVIQNGMNLTGVESYTQKVVLGLVILGAVLVDTRRKR